MTSKEALRTIANTKTNHIKSEKIGQPRVMYLVKEERKKEIETIKQDLERLEKIENLRTTPNALEHCLADFMNKCMVLEKENEKLKKAIEILKGYLSVSNEVDFDTYFTSQLEDEKQELLKEVLEDDK